MKKLEIANCRDCAHIQWNVSTLYVVTGMPRMKAPPACPLHSCGSQSSAKRTTFLPRWSPPSHLRTPQKTHTATWFTEQSPPPSPSVPGTGVTHGGWGERAAAKTTEGRTVEWCCAEGHVLNSHQKPRWENPQAGTSDISRAHSFALLRRNQHGKRWGMCPRVCLPSPVYQCEGPGEGRGSCTRPKPFLAARADSQVAHLRQACPEGSICPQHMSPLPFSWHPSCLEVATFHLDKQSKLQGPRSLIQETLPRLH